MSFRSTLLQPFLSPMHDARLRREDAELTNDAKTLLMAGLTIGGVAVVGGLSSQFHHHALVAIWGVFPIIAGCMGGVELVNPFPVPPTEESVQAKRRSVHHGLAFLLFSVLGAIGGGLLLATL